MPYSSLPLLPRRRVVVTGVGLVTSLGIDVSTTWSNLLAGESGIRDIRETPHLFPTFLQKSHDVTPKTLANRREELINAISCKVAAPVVVDGVSASEDPFAPTSRETRSGRMGMYAAEEAIASASPFSHLNVIYSPSRIGVCVGTGMPGIQDASEVSHFLYEGSGVKYNQINPFFVPKVLPNMIGSAIALKYGFQGPLSSVSTACATGGHNIGDAFRWISLGYADAALCGAAEACITPVSIAGFARMKALSTEFNDNPAAASRPFDKRRCGFVMGEGAGMLVLEEMESALARDAEILAELRGYGMSSDAYHVSSPQPEGAGARRCIEEALRDGGVDAVEVGYVNAHATGTIMGDEIELVVLAKVLRGERGHLSDVMTKNSKGEKTEDPLLVSSCKGALGHLLGAAGSVEAVATIMMLKKGIVPPNINLEDAIEHDESKLKLVTRATKVSECGIINAAISTSFGFGGVNSALLFTKM